MAGTYDVVVEIPRGSSNKYELDEETGQIRLDRVLYSAVHYPVDYGFIPGTRAEDGDHTDAMVLVSNPTFPGCVLEGRVVGMLWMSDEKGQDEKILMVAKKDPLYAHVNSYKDLPPHLLKEIENFFATYKLLEKKETNVGDWDDVAAAIQSIERAATKYAAEGGHK